MLRKVALLSIAISAMAAADSPTSPHGCALADQVRLCVNHAQMQRATCVGDDLDCQCTWASKLTTCYAPCIADKESSDNMHVAQGDQSSVCSQAAKFGNIAKDKEKQRLDEKKGKNKKKDGKEPPENTRDINDLNAAHEVSDALPDAEHPPSHEKDQKDPRSPIDTGLPSHPVRQSHAGTKSRKGMDGGDKDIGLESSAATLLPLFAGTLVALIGSTIGQLV